MTKADIVEQIKRLRKLLTIAAFNEIKVVDSETRYNFVNANIMFDGDWLQLYSNDSFSVDKHIDSIEAVTVDTEERNAVIINIKLKD